MALSLIWMDLGVSNRAAETPEEARQGLSEILTRLDEAGDSRREIYSLIV